MKIQYRTGDCLAGPEKIIAHGVNCKGAFGSGVAGQIRERFPAVYEAYYKAHSENRLKLGEVIWAVDQDKVFANCCTQFDYGPSKIQVDYDAVRECMWKLNFMANIYGIQEIALPKIGCGLAGGDWSIVSKIIEEQFTHVQPVVYEFNP